MLRILPAVLTLSLFLTPLRAGEFNKKISIGDAAPAFTKLPAADGKEYALDSFKDKEILVLVVTCNHCPVAEDYEERLAAFSKKYAGAQGKVAVLAVSVSLDEEDSLPKMKERAAEKKFPYPYALDASQQLGRDLGATRTPEVFVFNKERKLVYTGAVDDDQFKPTVSYLEAAVDATLKGAKVEKAETRPRGCGLTYTKK